MVKGGEETTGNATTPYLFGGEWPEPKFYFYKIYAYTQTRYDEVVWTCVWRPGEEDTLGCSFWLAEIVPPAAATPLDRAACM